MAGRSSRIFQSIGRKEKNSGQLPTCADLSSAFWLGLIVELHRSRGTPVRNVYIIVSAKTKIARSNQFWTQYNFENVRNQIGRCGIWCGSCAVGNGTLRQLAKRCKHIVGGYGVDEWGAKDFDGKEFMKGLTSIQNLPVCVGCLRGGGNDECRIRPCVSSKRISDCMKCDKMKTCKNTEALQKVRTGALRVGMLAKTEGEKSFQKQLIEKWTAEIRSKCPLCGA